jgi:hypothetical protein
VTSRASILAWGAAAAALVLLGCGLALHPSLTQGWLLPIASSFAVVGGLIASRRPENPIGWLFLGFGVLAAIDFAAYKYGYRALVTHPGSLPAGNVAVSVADHVWHPGFGLFVLSFLLFPNGRPLSPGWRWVVRATVVTYGGLALSGIFESGYLKAEEEIPAEPLFHGPVEQIASIVFGLLLFANLALLVVAGVSLIVRLKRSRGEERQQVKWFAYTVAFVMFSVPASLFALDQAYGVELFPLIPVSAAVAIFRYRLYDIDVVVNRTLVYGALTATLGGAYLACVLTLQLVLSPSSDLAIAGSTLAVAALFRPARARIQVLVDGRFYRRRYDAQRTLETFSARLREEVDIETLDAQLREVVRDTVQPAHVSVWLREVAR